MAVGSAVPYAALVLHVHPIGGLPKFAGYAGYAGHAAARGVLSA